MPLLDEWEPDDLNQLVSAGILPAGTLAAPAPGQAQRPGPQQQEYNQPDFEKALAQQGTSAPQLQKQPEKQQPTKFHRFMQFALPILQGAAYGLGTAQPTHALGGGGFLPALGGAFQREQGRELQVGLTRHQLAMQEQDRMLRQLTLENMIRHQGVVESGILGRLGEMHQRTEDAGAWGTPFEADMPNGQRGLFQQHSKTGDIRPVMLPGAAGGIAPGVPPTLGAQGGAATAPLAPGGVQGASPAVPSLGAPISGQLTRAKPGKHSPGEVKYDEGIPTGIYGEKDKLYRAGDPALTPDLKAALGDALAAHNQALQDKIRVASVTGESRGKSFGRNRPVDVLDTWNANRAVKVSAAEAEDNPERYVIASSPQMGVMKDFRSGKAAANVRSLNTAIGHLDTLNEAGKALDNKSWQSWNQVRNWARVATGDPKVTRFNNAATAVQNEMANVFKGTGATDQEINAWRNNLNASQSPAQLQGNMQQLLELMSSRMDALNSQYVTGVGSPRDFRFLNDTSRKILTKVGGSAQRLLESDKVGVASTGAQPQPQRALPPGWK